MKFHYLHFLVLLIILTLGIFTFFTAAGNRQLQLITGIVTSLAYIFWGIIHHALQKDLYMRVVIEYILMGAIGIVILATILL